MIPSHFTPELLNEKFNTLMTKNIGIEYTEVKSLSISGKMPVNDKTKQPFGILHGGASVVLAESLGSIGSNLMIDHDKQYCVGLEINANHIRSAKDGFVYGTATCVHAGRKTHIWEIKINNEQEKLVCTSRLTVAVLDKNQ